MEHFRFYFLTTLIYTRFSDGAFGMRDRRD